MGMTPPFFASLEFIGRYVNLLIEMKSLGDVSFCERQIWA